MDIKKTIKNNLSVRFSCTHDEQLFKALQRIQSELDENFLIESDKFKSAIADLFPGWEHKTLRKRAVEAVGMGIYTRLRDASKRNDVEIERLRCIKLLEEDGINEKLASEIVGAFSMLFEEEVDFQQQQQPVPIVHTPPQKTFTPALWLNLEQLNQQQQQPPVPVYIPPQPAIQTPQKTITPTTPVIGSELKFGKYDWRVLDVQNGKVLLISKDVTHVKKPYNESRTGVTWENCTLRQWLNRDFLSEFSSQEQSQICLSTIPNEDNQWYKTKGGNRTTDRIFLLSLDEVNNYRAAKFDNSQAWWWLRSPGDHSLTAACVGGGGDVYVYGYDVYVLGFYISYSDAGGGVRPALWLNLARA